MIIEPFIIEKILALSWWTIFVFGLKFISAWVAAGFIVFLPLIILKAVTE